MESLKFFEKLMQKSRTKGDFFNSDCPFLTIHPQVGFNYSTSEKVVISWAICKNIFHGNIH